MTFPPSNRQRQPRQNARRFQAAAALISTLITTLVDRASMRRAIERRLGQRRFDDAAFHLDGAAKQGRMVGMEQHPFGVVGHPIQRASTFCRVSIDNPPASPRWRRANSLLIRSARLVASAIGHPLVRLVLWQHGKHHAAPAALRTLHQVAKVGDELVTCFLLQWIEAGAHDLRRSCGSVTICSTCSGLSPEST